MIVLQGIDPRLPPDNIPHPLGYSEDSFYGRFSEDRLELNRACDASGYCTTRVDIEALPGQ